MSEKDEAEHRKMVGVGAVAALVILSMLGLALSKASRETSIPAATAVQQSQ